jgi:hypothetical protein
MDVLKNIDQATECREVGGSLLRNVHNREVEELKGRSPFPQKGFPNLC